MNAANICHICQLKDEKEGEKVKNKSILIKSDKLFRQDLLCLSVDNLNQAIEKNVLFDPQTIERSGTNMLVPFPM